MAKAVIFDLDGVLVMTDALHFAAWKRLADEIGIAGFSEADNARQRGVSRRQSLEVVLEKTDRHFSEEEKEELAARKNAYYVDSLAELGPCDVLPGVLDTFRCLRERGVPIAVGSASRNAKMILETLGLMPYIDALADGYDTARSKPDPEVFLVAAQKLGVPPQECLVVEDADAGVAAGVAAGMRVLGVGPAAANAAVDYAAGGLADASLDWEKMLS